MRPLQQALSCITRGIVRTIGYRAPQGINVLELSGGQLVALAGGKLPLALKVQQRYRLAMRTAARDRWYVVVTEYRYSIASVETGHELLSFHWHPRQVHPAYPHVHLETGLQLNRAFVGLPIPTALVPVAAVVWLLITELDVQPLREDWQVVLRAVGTRNEEAANVSGG